MAGWKQWITAGLLCATACDRDDGGDTAPNDTGTPDDNSTGEPGETGTPAESSSSGAPTPACMTDDDCAEGEMCSSGECVDMFWTVGADGAVLAVDLDGNSDAHPPLPADLAAIECEGVREAWAVGRAGLVARTQDGGRSWTTLPWPTTADLRDVASDDAGTVTAVGDAWVVLHDGGVRTIDAPTGALAGVAFGRVGMLAVGEDGTIWRGDPRDATATAVARLDGPASALSLAHADFAGVAVGPAGALWWSADGELWSRRDTGIATDLHAVQIASFGHAAIAVGDDGVVLHVSPDAIERVHLGDVALRGVHLDAWGTGAAVGEGGIVATTTDGGRSFAVHRVAPHDLFGVDAVGALHW